MDPLQSTSLSPVFFFHSYDVNHLLLKMVTEGLAILVEALSVCQLVQGLDVGE
jgi:hypothetical protein